MSPKLGRLYTMKSPITMIVENKDIVELRRFLLLSSYISLSAYILKFVVVVLLFFFYRKQLANICTFTLYQLSNVNLVD